MTNTSCCDCSIKTHDGLSETYTVLYQNKVEKQCILLAFIIRIYHDARSAECQIQQLRVSTTQISHQQAVCIRKSEKLRSDDEDYVNEKFH
jgi:hypothetical protein